MSALIKLEFSWQIFEKFSNIIFHENQTNNSRVVPGRQAGRRTDRHDETIVAFCNFVKRV